MPQEITISDKPQLPRSSDYAYLRSKGLEYIEKLGSRLWTDYNIHDPGITLLELLSYAISDLGYRTSIDTKDLLTAMPGTVSDPAMQTFFTARNIMTVNPLTQNDYRKLLIDVDGIRNGWMQCKSCGCEDHYLYADCKTSKLQYDPTHHRITLKGMYDVLVEFEDEEGVGDLNTGKIKYSFPFNVNGKLTNAVIEMRLPSWHEIEENKELFELFREPDTTIMDVDVEYISGNKFDDTDVLQEDLANALRRPVYATINVTLQAHGTGPGVNMRLSDVPATLWFHGDDERKAIELPVIKEAIRDASPSGIIPRYAERVRKADEIITIVRQNLQATRNLCEDYCTIKAVETEEVAMCADIDVYPDADIEKVLAQAYYIADQYMSTDIKFYSLKELLDAGKTTDEIFDGPALSNGFIDNDQMESTQLKTVLHSSDIINMIMDIPGVAAVRNFTLVKYDRDGNRSEAQSWSLDISYNHQPRLYFEGSKLVAYKNGLPFLPDKLELSDTLQIIKGRNIQPKYSLTDLDMAVPTGTYYPLTDYYPLQYSLPITYGVGEAGLPATAGAERKAQAKQLKAYLLFFEQMLVNYLEQLSHVKDFFSLESDVDQSYYTRLIGDDIIAGVTDYYDTDSGTIDQNTLNGLIENEVSFLNRRNRFLDHLLSRFAEQFTDYTLMVYSYTDSQKLADKALIRDKIAFLKDYPFISSNRARAVNYKDENRVCNSYNVAGLQKRISRLLGFDGLASYITFVPDNPELNTYRWILADNDGNTLLITDAQYQATQTELENQLQGIIELALNYIADEDSYFVEQDENDRWNVSVSVGFPVATPGRDFDTEEEARAFVAQVVAFINNVLNSERIYMVEHLLLRPRNWAPFTVAPTVLQDDNVTEVADPADLQEEGSIVVSDGKSSGQYAMFIGGPDPLLPVCIPPDCNSCGEEDPYSFRMSIVMNGEVGEAGSNLEFRRFAEETIRMETPAHIGLKVCWVSTQQLLEFGTIYCDWLHELAKEEPAPDQLFIKLTAVIDKMAELKNVYPPARLHDCSEGSEDSRVFLNHTII